MSPVKPPVEPFRRPSVTPRTMLSAILRPACSDLHCSGLLCPACSVQACLFAPAVLRRPVAVAVVLAVALTAGTATASAAVSPARHPRCHPICHTPDRPARSPWPTPGLRPTPAPPPPAGWSESGAVAASFTEAGGHTGDFRLTHWSADRRTGWRPTQQITGLRRGAYTLRAWVRSSGDQRATRRALRGCGGPAAASTLPLTGGEWWVQVAVRRRVTRGSLHDRHRLRRAGRRLAQRRRRRASPASPAAPARPAGWRSSGADVSHLTKNEDHGAVYRDAAGRRRDPLADPARQRRQLRPAEGVGRPGRRLQRQGRRAGQGAPGQGAGHEAADRLPLLRRLGRPGQAEQAGRLGRPAVRRAEAGALRPHLRRARAPCARRARPADMAQVGNEINGGMLWPDGRWDNWDGLAALLTAGSDAVRAASPGTKVVLHLAEGGNNGGHRWWFDNAIVPRRAVRRHRGVALRLLARPARLRCRPTCST